MAGYSLPDLEKAVIELRAANSGAEPALGNPATTGYVLSSTNAGARSWVAQGAGGMVYPGVGIALSTGAAWGTSIADASAHWNTAYGWGNHAGLYDAAGAASVVAGNLSTHTGLSTTAHGGIVASSDSRLSDARTPAAHVLNSGSHTVSGLTTGQFLKATGAATFGFAAHGLTYSDVGAASASDTRLSDARVASDVYAWAKASVKPSYAYSEVGAVALQSSTPGTAQTGHSNVAGKTTLGSGTFYSLASSYASVVDTARPTGTGLEVVIGSAGTGVTTEAAAAWFQKIASADTSGHPHTVNISSVKTGGAGGAAMASGSLNIVSIDEVGWNGTDPGGIGQTFVEGMHLKSIGSWTGSGSGSVQGAIIEAVVDADGTGYGFVNGIECNVYNLRADPPSGNKTWAVLNKLPADGGWPGNLIVNIMANNYTLSTYPTDVGFCVGNGWASRQMYTGLLIRDDAIATDGHPILTKGLTQTKTGMVGVGSGLAGADATADLSIVRSSAGINDWQQIMSMARMSSGTTADGFGFSVAHYLQKAGTPTVAAYDVTAWYDITNTRAERSFWVSGDGADRQIIKMAADGTQGLLGFFGAGATAKPTVTGSRGGQCRPR